MALEGQLEDVSLADVCQLLAMGRKTGCLTVTDRSSFGHIYFHHGRVVFAQVLNHPDRLGDLLVRNGALSRDQLAQAMEHQAGSPGRLLGRSVVDLGLLGEEKVARYLTIQVSEAVYHLFTWNRGAFHFEPDEVPGKDGAIPLSIHTEGLLLEGARRVDEWTFIQKKVPSMESLFVLDRGPEQTEGVELTGAQEKLLPLLDGTRSVGEMAVEAGLVEFDAAKAIYGLVQAGFARRIGQRAIPDDPKRKAAAEHHLSTGIAFDEAGLTEDAVRELRAALETDPRHAGARARLALLHLREGSPERVLDLYADTSAELRGSYEALRLRALALEALDSYDEALTLLDRAAELRPSDADVHLARGIVLFRSRQPGRAVKAFCRYREGISDASPPDPAYHGFALLAAAADGDWDQAIRLGREGLSRERDPLSVLVGLSDLIGSRLGRRLVEGVPIPASAALPGPADRRMHPRRRATDAAPGRDPRIPAQLPTLPELEEEYVLVRELGRGGTSAVYLARERELSRFVAIKVLLPPFRRDEEAANRLVQEARILGRLQHPHLIMLLGVRRLDEGRLALVLQYLPGTTLREVLQKEGPLPFSQVRAVLQGVGQALAYIHQNGVVHRDVKPENVHVEEEGGAVRLADFGNARLRNRHTGMTVPERAVGTPAFMSPEQVEGRALDGRSDIYSLGLVAYEMLTGQQPWAGEGLYGTLLKQQSEDLPSISRFRPETPPSLQEAVERALAKDPEDRWESASDFLAALELEAPPFPPRESPRTMAALGRRAGPTAEERRGAGWAAAGAGGAVGDPGTPARAEPQPGDADGAATWLPQLLAEARSFADHATGRIQVASERLAPHARTGALGLARGTRILLIWLFQLARIAGSALWSATRAVAAKVPEMGEVTLLFILLLLAAGILTLLNLWGVALPFPFDS
jgi:Tfp pilus assembly protein PilF